MRLACIIAAVIFVHHAAAQETGTATGKDINSTYYSKHIPKQPEPSALGSFGSIPVNYYTGQPEISLEIMRLKGRSMELPVALNYDASGVRTDEISGTVGLKWSLSVNFSIVRQIAGGWPDEHPVEGYWRRSKDTNYFTAVASYNEWVGYSESKKLDTEPDEFVANIPGRSIKFVFNKDKEVVVIPRQNVKVSYNLFNNKLNAFEITTEDGFRYLFGSTESA